jgi:hypothetical protein
VNSHEHQMGGAVKLFSWRLARQTRVLHAVFEYRMYILCCVLLICRVRKTRMVVQLQSKANDVFIHVEQSIRCVHVVR